MSYCSLREKSRYLKDLTTQGQGKTLRADEISSCEEYADAMIEGRLGKSWATGSVPVLVERIADLLGSAMAYKFLLTGQLSGEADYPKSLREEALEMLTQIQEGKIGLKLPDGSWDEDYPGDANSEESDGGNFGLEIIV